ncbi:MAG: alpha/beta hydrolase [Candidatus Saccharibacteria bacterium]|nr:alpha/beta hydrolase [Candidatus Saccharibacteria bacterium]
MMGDEAKSNRYIHVGEENSQPIELYYEDHGSGQPVVLIHGFPLSGAAWEKQVLMLLKKGYRTITYDRRGFGKSSQPTAGYDYDTFAEDLNKLMMELDLLDAVLVGHSMGTGEVTRYLATYGSGRVSKAVFISPIPPFVLKTPDNPQGVDQSVFDGIKQSILADRFAYLTSFISDFYNLDVTLGDTVSDEVFQGNWNVAVAASPKGTYDCVDTWLTDFREDLTSVDVPALIIHGDADRILPITATGGEFMHKAVKGSRLVVLEDAPHGIPWTHAREINTELINFLR